MRVNIGPYPKEKSKAKRKIDVRIDDYDIWSLDHTLAHIILPALKKIKAAKQGASGDLFDMSYLKLEYNSKEYKAAEKKSAKDGFKKWNDILNAMIYSFSEIVKDNGDSKFFKKDSYDKEGHRSHQDKIQFGLDLFGKYYQSLWT